MFQVKELSVIETSIIGLFTIDFTLPFALIILDIAFFGLESVGVEWAYGGQLIIGMIFLPVIVLMSTLVLIVGMFRAIKEKSQYMLVLVGL